MASSFPFPLPQVHRSPKRDKRHPSPCACLLLKLYYTLEKPHWTKDALPRELQMGFPDNLLPPFHFWEPPPEILGVCSQVIVRLQSRGTKSVNQEQAEPLGNASPGCLFSSRAGSSPGLCFGE